MIRKGFKTSWIEHDAIKLNVCTLLQMLPVLSDNLIFAFHIFYINDIDTIYLAVKPDYYLRKIYLQLLFSIS